MAKLIFKDDFMRNEYLLTGDEISIGRAPDNKLTIPDYQVFSELPGNKQREYYKLLVRVSRRHAKIVCVDGRYSIYDTGSRDSGSSHGTFINGERIMPQQQYELKDGDIIRFGSVEAIFRG